MSNIDIDNKNLDKDINELRKIKQTVDAAIAEYEKKKTERLKELVDGNHII